MLKAARLFFISTIFLSAHAEAQKSQIDSLINLLSKSPEDTNKVDLLRNIGVGYANQDPRKAIVYWMQGIRLSKKLNYIKGLARNYINIGTGYSYLGKFDSTIIYADSGIIYSKIIGDPERLALVYLNKGDGYRNLGDFKLALLFCDTAGMYAAKTINIDRQARIYDIISGIYQEQRQFTAALDIQRKALELYKKDSNFLMEGQVYDDFGLIYQQMGKLDSALFFHKLAISFGERLKDYKNLSVYHYGVAQVYTDMGKYKEAEAYAAKSLLHAKEQENNLQLATTYSLLGKIYLNQRKFADAVKAGNTAYIYAVDEVQTALQQETASLLGEAYSSIGDDKNAYKYLNISCSLKDSIIKQQYNTQVVNLQSSFELKEKDKEILLLGKDKELQLQKFFRQRLLFAGATVLLLLALIGIWLLVNRNKLKQRMKELELRNQIASDLHDEVGSSLSSIHMLSQMAMKPGNEATHKNIIEKMSINAKETMDKMGDIVWMIKSDETESGNLNQRIERFAYEVCSSKNIDLILNLTELEKVKLTPEQRKSIYLVFKEALNNAAKYSGTEKIEVKATLQNKQLELLVKDFGKGFDQSTAKRGNGLDNMNNRAKDIDGHLTLNSVISEGTAVTFYVPL
jgi:two-component system, NarL family, sensor histidine kinase UhpB